jgi:hypothetical protein
MPDVFAAMGDFKHPVSDYITLLMAMLAACATNLR